VIEQFLSPY